jgi:ERCC4-related helicase
MTTKSSAELNLKDRLSRLTYRQACKLLGAEGERLIRQGGKYEVLDIDQQVSLDDDRFRLALPEANVTIILHPGAEKRLHFECSSCDSACEHAGAAFSLILEEKTALGLAKPPRVRTPIESLGEEELVRRAIEERQERATTEKMTLKSLNPKLLWTDYTITSAESGKTYRLALRGWERGESYCSCPDFRNNTLGTCKHVLNALGKLKRRFSASARQKPYRRKNISVNIRYGKTDELRLLLPDKLDNKITKVVSPLRDQPINDIHALLKSIRKLETIGHDVTIYPDAEEHIQRRLFQERIEATVAGIRKNPEKHPLRKQLLKAELLPYQLDGIAFAVGAGRAILADDMGLGKTIQGIGVAEMLARETGIRRVLIICPTSLKSQWRNEINRFCDRDCQLILGSAQERAQQYGNGNFFTVCNYEQVLRDIGSIEEVKWDLIVLDEGQRIKNWEAKTSRIVRGLRSPFALVLSGTPLENRLGELFTVAGFVDDRRLGPAFRFFNRHRVVDEKGKVLGYKNLSKLRDNLKPILLRRTRESVMKQLPSRTTEIVRIAPTEEQLGLHRVNMQIVSSIVNKTYISEMDLLRLQKALLMCRMAANSTFLVDKQTPSYSSKLEELDRLFEQLSAEDGRKIVLFSEWTTMLDQIEPLLAKHKMDYVRLDGSVPQKKRQQLVHRFQTDPTCRLFITTNAGSTGLNLQSANTVINVELPWNPAVLEQRISRAHRLGQKQPVQVYVLVTEETIEENLLTTLSAKHQLALAALDADSEIDNVDLACGMEELKRRLEILLGAKPEAPLDQSEKARQEEGARLLLQREKIASAGGKLLSAAFAFLGEMLPEEEETEESRQMTEMFKNRLAECLEKDEQGRCHLRVTLPDPSTLDDLAGSMGRLLARNSVSS